MLRRKPLLGIVTLIALLLAGFATLSANAQATSPATPPATPAANGFGRGRANGMLANAGAMQAFQACSASDYTDVIAKTLGLTATDLRVALVSGKTIQDIAKDKNVTTDTIRSAVVDAQKADLAQSVKDGVITQAQADFISGRLNRVPPPSASAATPPATPPALNGNAPRTRPSVFPPVAGGFGLGFTVSRNVPVQNYVVAAKALNISCAALITATQQGRQSIAQVAKSNNATAQTVIDALVKAHNDALDEEVKEGLITQAEEAGQVMRLTAQMTAIVNGPGQGAFPGFFQGQPRQPVQPRQPQQQTRPGLRGRFGNLACRMFGFFCGNQGTAPQPGRMATPVPTQSS